MPDSLPYNQGFKSVGFRDCVVYELNSSGYPKAVDDTPYVGYFLSGPKAFALNLPNANIISHIGRDRVEETDQLPTKEALSAEIRTSGVDLDIDAFLQGTLKVAVGSHTTLIGRYTDQQGYEPDIGVIAWQQSKLSGSRRWHYYALPSARASIMSAGMEENPVDQRYMLNINPMSKFPWGLAMTDVTHGMVTSNYFDMYSLYAPANFPMVSFKADGIEDTFDFDEYKTARTHYTVYVNGVLQAAGITKSDGSMLFAVAPVDDAIITAWLV